MARWCRISTTRSPAKTGRCHRCRRWRCIRPGSPPSSGNCAWTRRELRYNLAQSLVDEDRHREASVLFRELHRNDPDEFRFALQLAHCCLALGDAAELALIVADLDVRRRAVAAAARTKARALRKEIVARLKKEVAEARAAAGTPPPATPAAAPSSTPPATPPPTPDPATPPTAAPGRERRRRPAPTPEERQRLRELLGTARFSRHSVDYLAGQLHLLRGEPQAALERFLKVEEAGKHRPGQHIHVGRGPGSPRFHPRRPRASR